MKELKMMVPHRMTEAQLLQAILGALLICLASSLFLLIFGKHLNKSSFARQFLRMRYNPDFVINMTVFAGIVFSSAFQRQLYHEHIISFWPFDSPQYQIKTQIKVLVLSGLAIGMGSVLSGGCTFGHGVIGIPLLNYRSLVSTIIFSLTAYLTNRYNLSKRIPDKFNTLFQFNLTTNIDANYYIYLLIIIPFLFYIVSKNKSLIGFSKVISAFFIGIIGGFGLMVSGITKRQLVMSMFEHSPKWNPTIIIFFLSTIFLNLIFFNIFIKKNVTPLFATHVQSSNFKFNFQLILGSVLFGVGWGLAGLCPGASYLLLPLKNVKIPFYWGLSFCVGIKIGEILNSILLKLQPVKKEQQKIVPVQEQNEEEKKSQELNLL